MLRLVFYGGLLWILWSVLFLGSSRGQHAESIRFVFYNVENLFDIEDDSLTGDEEFTPGGDKAWNISRYHEKLDNIARTLTAVGEWELPALVGLCEVENRAVLDDLTAHRLLSAAGYEVIHRDSPDRRGIDVALLYKTASFLAVESAWIHVTFQIDSNMLTRDILYVKGLLFQMDTIHIFINHWPSRWGGVEASMPKRVTVANILRKYTDSLFVAEENPDILIAGDLNDNPCDSAVHKVLGTRKYYDGRVGELYNLMFPVYLGRKEGSLKYRADWEMYDQIIVSSSLLDKTGLQVKNGKASIFSSEYLLMEDEKYLGVKPFRTYAGPRYLGGFSDHLPVFIDLIK